MMNLFLTAEQWLLLLSEVEFICDAKEVFTENELVTLSIIRQKLQAKKLMAEHAKGTHHNVKIAC